jgi:hypothetical protein
MGQPYNGLGYSCGKTDHTIKCAEDIKENLGPRCLEKDLKEIMSESYIKAYIEEGL